MGQPGAKCAIGAAQQHDTDQTRSGGKTGRSEGAKQHVAAECILGSSNGKGRGQGARVAE